MNAYRITTHVRLESGHWSNGQMDCLLAAPSRAAAARTIGVTDGFMKKYGSATGNAADIATANAQPGTLLVREAGAYGEAWKPVAEVTR